MRAMYSLHSVAAVFMVSLLVCGLWCKSLLELEPQFAHLRAERAGHPQASARVADMRRRVAGQSCDLAHPGRPQFVK